MIRLLALSVALLLAACGSAEDKAKMRTAISAFGRASSGPDAQNERAMIDLQNAIDVVPDSKGREELLRCQRLLVTRRIAVLGEEIAFKQGLLKIRHGLDTTRAEADKAMKDAQAANPLPDYRPIVECLVEKLPALAR